MATNLCSHCEQPYDDSPDLPRHFCSKTCQHRRKLIELKESKIDWLAIRLRQGAIREMKLVQPLEATTPRVEWAELLAAMRK